VRHRRTPRTLGAALRPARRRARPRTLLAAVQETWPRVAGEAVVAQAEPVSEREGVVTVACRSATWAQELDLLQADILERLNEALEEWTPEGSEAPLNGLRFTADAARHRS
jgi:predicted nucleic acid-binding Zn ribbon protein